MFSGLDAKDLGLREVTVTLENGSSATQFVMDLDGMPSGMAMSCRKLRVYTKVKAVHDKVWVPQNGMLTKDQPGRVFTWRRQQQHEAMPVKSKHGLKTYADCKAEADKVDAEIDRDLELAEKGDQDEQDPSAEASQDDDGFGGRNKVESRQVVEDPEQELANEDDKKGKKKAKATASAKKRRQKQALEDDDAPQIEDLGDDETAQYDTDGEVDMDMKAVSEKHLELTGKSTTSFMALQVSAFLRGEGSGNHITGAGAPVASETPSPNAWIKNGGSAGLLD